MRRRQLTDAIGGKEDDRVDAAAFNGTNLNVPEG
jgi:hypothetical protein